MYLKRTLIIFKGLRATAITRMYEGGVPQKIISEKSGHRSIKGLRAYERTSLLQEKAAGTTVTTGESFVHSDMSAKTQVTQYVKSDENTKPPNSIMPNFSGLQNCTFKLYCPCSLHCA